ncbi:hypothetical protein A0H76_2268 [Hepatospora eriocheir]|uniref:Uncharacterized protein n=1 Tax=Hepatospora eriocheir TaxID=1081669 RepID=A0A1X0Q9D1_9MICR|nr:hypothetical protein A0H76_478 [Hepatospora eriocheir]ORD98565.1 hypothetical protein A0H76_2268 [Hepatospora eriocheir]
MVPLGFKTLLAHVSELILALISISSSGKSNTSSLKHKIGSTCSCLPVIDFVCNDLTFSL